MNPLPPEHQGGGKIGGCKKGARHNRVAFLSGVVSVEEKLR